MSDDTNGNDLLNPKDPNQLALFEETHEGWRELWKGMPDFEQRDLTSWQQLIVHFKDRDDREAFARLIAQPITDDTRSLWFPKLEWGSITDKHFIPVEGAKEKDVQPKYPVYIVSKGRWETRQTSRALEKMRVPYKIVVEPQERDSYASVINPDKILVLPFSNLGQGSIPARNWIWEHAKATGAKRHWILDDNIKGFYRLYNNNKVLVSTGSTFRAAEDFVDRYTNVGLAGFQYFMFAPRKTVIPPLTLNTRIYSCILIDNSLDYRWRGRYNEDTDLSLRVLKDGMATVLFNAFLADKSTTLTMTGGNTESLYKITDKDGKDGRLLMAESLKEQHPDLVRIVHKWGRYQHHVHYKVFRNNKLVPRADFVTPSEPNNFGMKLKMLAPDEPRLTPI